MTGHYRDRGDRGGGGVGTGGAAPIFAPKKLIINEINKKN